MARSVFNSSKIVKGFIIRNIYTDNTYEDHEFFVGDVIENIRYDDPINDIIDVKARVTDVSFGHRNLRTSVSNDISLNLANGSHVELISLDYSEDLHSKVVTIPSFYILDYRASKPVKKVIVLPTLKYEYKVKLSDGTETSIVFKEGMSIFGLAYMDFDKEVIGNYVLRSFIHGRQDNGIYEPVGLFLIGETTVSVPFDAIVKCGVEGVSISKNDDLSTIIAEHLLSGDANISLPVTKQDSSLSLSHNISIIGPNSLINPALCKKVDFGSEAVLAGDINIDKDSNVEICGVTFTENSNIINNGAKKLKFKNCSFIGINPTASKSYLIKDGSFGQCDEEGLLLQIENCYFGDNLITDAGNTYNLFEMRAKIADGSYIKNCYFAKEVCTHNIINFYDVSPNATITIENNHFEKSVNAIRIGFIDDAHCTLNIINNTYDETDDDPNWAGLLLIQPYGTRTTTFEHVDINFINNVYTKGKCQDYYVWCGPSDTLLTDGMKPKINFK